MLYPGFQEFKKLVRKGNLIALIHTMPADLETPVSCFLKLAGRELKAFLLESAEQGEKVGRYSFIGLNPALTLVLKDQKLYSEPAVGIAPGQDLTGAIESILSRFSLANPEKLPGFCGGFVGYFGYENVVHFEDVHLNEKPGPGVPDAIFYLTRDFVIFDHFRKTLSVAVLVEADKKKLKAVYESGRKRIAGYVRKLLRPLKIKTSREGREAVKISPKANMSRAQFCRKVNRIKEYIRAGDCIQVVLSQRFRLPSLRDEFRIYRALRSINPSPYMFYFRWKNICLVGSSPEVLVRKTGRLAEVRPIAGTRPRGKNPEEDRAFEENLRKSSKEMAEHLMLVDLGRNDLGRVCDFKTVEVKSFARVEKYSHVMHLVSDVTGRLKRGKTAFDLLKNSFPAGTVTGAPKIRAMQIINELEPEKRGPYAGCLGYFSFNHDMDMCITIRTLVSDGKNMHIQAGAGVVKDSSPAREYQETVNKSRAMLKALERQGDF